MLTRRQLILGGGALVAAGTGFGGYGFAVEPYRTVVTRYRLTPKGLGLYPVLMSLARWGDEWMDKGEGAPLEYRHKTCGHVTQPVVSCSECHEPLRPQEVSPEPGAPLRAALDTAPGTPLKDVDLASLISAVHPLDSATGPT